MSNTNAYVYPINPIGSGAGENSDVHQTSPCWVLTFISWKIRDTLRTDPFGSTDYTTVSDPLVVENDCIQVSTTMNKGTMTPAMSATLLMTDVNYMTAVNPGDFVFVNMLNWDSDVDRIVNQINNSKPINGPDDGFKGVFKIQSVR